MALSVQTLSEADRRLVAGWAAACAEHVLWIFEAERPDDDRPRQAIRRTQAYSHGESDTASEIRRRFGGGNSSSGVSPAAASAARSAGQASAVCHMGAHALGAAGYAIKAISLKSSEAYAEDEIAWQLEQMTPDMRAVLRALPAIGQDRSGPLGPGLLATGQMRQIIGQIQAMLT